MKLMEEGKNKIVLFHPTIPDTAISEVIDTLKSRWIGQGPKVEKLESKFSEKFANNLPAVAVGSGTDALHLSYILAGLKPGDEVITPVFTCTATNIPFLYMGVKIVFADIQTNTLNIDPVHVETLINDRTKAIVCVHYGGLPCDMKELRFLADSKGIPIIEDAAHALGGKYCGDSIGSISEFTMFSFQAIKHLTTGDGGMLVVKDKNLVTTAKRIRWFGIDREAKQGGIWENDIWEVGYKYQMTDIAAAIGLGSLKKFDNNLKHRKKLFKRYEENLQNIPGLTFVGGGFNDREHAAWLCTILVENRYDLQNILRQNGIESNQVHFRNDRYSIFKESANNCYPNMDKVEDKYLVLPLHTHMDESDVERVCSTILSGW
jgi:dTDP-4-amino-4,6-dideoxygalactose transaminase